MSKRAVATLGLMLAAVFVTTSCSGTGSPGSSSPRSSASQSTTTPNPALFTSATYGYALTLPVGWRSKQALYKWDGDTGLSIGSAEVDKFQSGTPAAAWGVAARWTGDLAAYTSFSIAWSYRHHEDTCPPAPATRAPVTVGGEPGVLLEYNCGILINVAATVHRGVGYMFVFRDSDVAAATDPTDHATFLQMLGSVHFPN